MAKIQKSSKQYVWLPFQVDLLMTDILSPAVAYSWIVQMLVLNIPGSWNNDGQVSVNPSWTHMSAAGAVDVSFKNVLFHHKKSIRNSPKMVLESIVSGSRRQAVCNTRRRKQNDNANSSEGSDDS